MPTAYTILIGIIILMAVRPVSEEELTDELRLAGCGVEDLLETLRRWEVFRKEGRITEAVKAQLQNMAQEHTLLLNEKGELELTPWQWLPAAAGGDSRVTVFLFERKGMQCAAVWHNTGNGSLVLQLPEEGISYRNEIDGDPIPLESNADHAILPVDRKRYLITDMEKQTLIRILTEAKL